MDSRDFRTRLKNHKTPYNPSSWSQMEEMLDAIPVEVGGENTDRKKLLLLLLLLFVILASVMAVNMWREDILSDVQNQSKNLNQSIGNQHIIDQSG